MKKLILLFTAILTALLLASTVYAADITLSSSCSLADAIIAANNDRAEGDCPAGRGADIIALTRDITLDGGLPKITSDIAIEGNGYTISGDHRYRMFYNDGGALTIKDLTMTKGYVEADLIRNEDGTFKASTANSIGGAIYNVNGTLSISDSSFSHNSAYGGGAIYNVNGTLSISDSRFSGNSAEAGGGAIYNANGTVSISDSVFSHNSAWGGGAISNGDDGELGIVNSTFSDNSAENVGGAISNGDDGELSIVNSTFSDNLVESRFSGAIYRRGGAIYNGDDSELSISDSRFSGNSAENDGGAIYNGKESKLSIVNSTFSYNSAENDGGAIENWWGVLSISSSAFSHNSAKDGGAISNGDDGELSIANSAFSDNFAIFADRGGAIYTDGELSIVNSAFSDNFGGAIYNGDDGELSIVNSTFSDKWAAGAAIYNKGDGKLSIVNSIIAGGGDACYSESRLRHNISNFIEDGSCSPALRGDPMLVELVEPADGSPAYFPLLAGSPAIDAADDDYCPETDQIGTARPQGGGCDIGAFEYKD